MARKSKLTDQNINDILAAHENGQKVDDICKQFSISPATFYNYRAKAMKPQAKGPAKKTAKKPNAATIAKAVREAMEFDGTTDQKPIDSQVMRLLEENARLRKALAAIVVSGVAMGSLSIEG